MKNSVKNMYKELSRTQFLQLFMNICYLPVVIGMHRRFGSCVALSIFASICRSYSARKEWKEKVRKSAASWNTTLITRVRFFYRYRIKQSTEFSIAGIIILDIKCSLSAFSRFAGNLCSPTAQFRSFVPGIWFLMI